VTQYSRICIRSAGAQYYVKKQYLLLHSVLTEITVSLLVIIRVAIHTLHPLVVTLLYTSSSPLQVPWNALTHLITRDCVGRGRFGDVSEFGGEEHCTDIERTD
jgi:hypothetical protein